MSETERPAAPELSLADQMRLAEALIFASAAPVSPRALTQALPDGVDVDAVMVALRAQYAGREIGRASCRERV